jgi:3-deoxy-D-manno-octulosonic-acid transferase
LPLRFLYNLVVGFVSISLRIPAFFNPKIKKFVSGRKAVWNYLEGFRSPEQKLIWLHAASLGEFEQGLPILEHLQDSHPDFQYLVTFFSPSGYEVKKGKIPGIGMCYLPMDTPSNARRFLAAARPSIAIFVKYEVWPNFYRECKASGIPLLMISALFKPDQIYFKGYGSFLRSALNLVSHFYVQDKLSASLLESIGLSNLTISGDTRFDRVSKIKEQDNQLDFMEIFKGSRTCFVAGSTWPEDDQVLLPFIRKHVKAEDFCVVIAPHKVDLPTIKKLMGNLGKYAITLSTANPADLTLAKVLVVDSIGLLTRIYRYADFAYVGGGFATGLHNTLEPAVFGIPVLIGPNYKGFREAERLVEAGGIISVKNQEELLKEATSYLFNADLRKEKGHINTEFISSNVGSTVLITKDIEKLLSEHDAG